MQDFDGVPVEDSNDIAAERIGRLLRKEEEGRKCEDRPFQGSCTTVTVQWALLEILSK